MTIPIGSAPGRDREQEENQSRLDGVAAPFSAVFLGGAGDSDGSFSWDTPIELRHQQGETTDLHLRYRPDSVPLEVGHVEPETIPWHVRYSGGVARWPYGSEVITLLLTTRAYPGRTGGRALRPELLAGARVIDSIDRQEA